MASTLFQSIQIGKITVKNRFSLGAAIDFMDDNPEARIARFAGFAEGGVGLIVSGATTLADADTWQRVVDAVHERGGLMAIQLIADKIPGVLVSHLPEDSPFFTPLLPTLAYREDQRGFSEDEILTLIQGYADKAKKVKNIGADAVEIHAAHTSLPSQFLSPVTNRRDDRWGGSVENRARFHSEILKAIRAETGDDFPVIIKLGVEDPAVYKEGLTLEDGVKAAIILAECGYDALEISQGLMEFSDCGPGGAWSNTPLRTHIRKPEEEAYFRNQSRAVKSCISRPVICTGGMRSFEVMQHVVEGQYADMVGLCRPLICEPALIKHFFEGDLRRAACISCNHCALEGQKRLPLQCVLNKKNG